MIRNIGNSVYKHTPEYLKIVKKELTELIRQSDQRITQIINQSQKQTKSFDKKM